MKTTINMTNHISDTDRFSSADDLKNFYESKNIDGLELMLTSGDASLNEKLEKSKIIGVHINTVPSWLALWNGNKEELLKEYITEEECIKQFGGITKNALIQKYRKELDFAERVGAEYVVFHVCEVTCGECADYKLRRSDEEVVKASCELINALLEGQNYHFYFLCENLWWAGLNMRNPEITKMLMDNIEYSKKGIMLDTGHMIHLNNDIKTQEEAIDFINEILDNHGSLCKYIKGVHLHQSISGDYVKEYLKNPIKLKGSYMQKFCDIMMHLSLIHI